MISRQGNLCIIGWAAYVYLQGKHQVGTIMVVLTAWYLLKHDTALNHTLLKSFLVPLLISLYFYAAYQRNDWLELLTFLILNWLLLYVRYDDHKEEVVPSTLKSPPRLREVVEKEVTAEANTPIKTVTKAAKQRDSQRIEQARQAARQEYEERVRNYTPSKK